MKLKNEILELKVLGFRANSAYSKVEIIQKASEQIELGIPFVCNEGKAVSGF